MLMATFQNKSTDCSRQEQRNRRALPNAQGELRDHAQVNLGVAIRWLAVGYRWAWIERRSASASRQNRERLL
jgi:hypothetical protein